LKALAGSPAGALCFERAALGHAGAIFHYIIQSAFLSREIFAKSNELFFPNFVHFVN
jgi:hypothetical protein